MGKLVRKNLVVDAEKVRELARQRGTSESAAVRQVIDFALAAEEAVAIFDQLAARGGVDDVFGKLGTPADDVEAEAAGERESDPPEGNLWPEPKSRIRAS